MTKQEFNRRLVLTERPVGVPTPSHFKRDDQPIESIVDGQFLVRNLFLSIDPAQRGWVNASANYADPVPIGGVMRSLAVAMVEESRDQKYPVGQHLYGWFGWQDYCIATDKSVLSRVDLNNGPLSTGAGIFGITGITAYLALTEIGQPKARETVLVSTAAGAVGSIVGQIARRLGCQVVGLTGADDKVKQCVAEYGYHCAVNYRTNLTTDTLRAACPHGIDVFFDNTGGEIADAVWPLLNARARIVQCGTASIAVWSPPPNGPRRERDVLTKRLRHEGFVIFDHVAKFPAVIEQLATWLKDGSVVSREDIEDGIDRAPGALQDLYRGENRGKKIIRL